MTLLKTGLKTHYANPNGGSTISISVGQFVHLGTGVVFGKDVVIGDMAIIKYGAIVGNNVRIGIGTMIKELTTIGDNCVIENDVAIGRMVRIGNGSKIGSLSEIGEHAQIGSGVKLPEKSIILPYQRVGMDKTIA